MTYLQGINDHPTNFHNFREQEDTDSECTEAAVVNQISKPCELPRNKVLKTLAEESCIALKTSPHFMQCHESVEVQPYFEKLVELEHN